MIKKNVPHYTPGLVHYQDGREVEYMWVELPKSGDAYIRVTNDPKHKKAEKVAASEIKCITYWSQLLPEKKLTLYYLHADKSSIPLTGTMPVDVWGYPIASSEWGTVYMCNPSYELNKKTGEIVRQFNVRAVQMGNVVHYETVPAACYLVCRDFDNAQLIGSSLGEEMFWAALKMKHITPFFESNTELARRIEEKKLVGKDIQYILDEMALFEGMKDAITPVTPTQEYEVSATINGTIGDDE